MSGYTASCKEKVFSGGTGYAAHTKPFLIFRKFYGIEKYSLPDLQHFLYQLYHEESEYNEHYHVDRDSRRCSQNEFILELIGETKVMDDKGRMHHTPNKYQ